MKFLSRVVLLFLLVTIVKSGAGQVDPHFSQYYVYPSYLNPALTGIFDGDYRVSGIYRSQWGSISAPFSTPGASVEITTNKNINFGVSILNQTAGNGGYNYLTAYGSASYTGVKFGVNGYQRLVFGLQAGLINRRFDQTKFTTGNQWNPITGYNPGIQPEALSINKSLSFDAGAGLLYFDAEPGKKANLFVGFSTSHLTQPEDKFTSTSSKKEKLPMRFTGHAGVKITVNDMLSITPNVLFMRQGNATEKMAGAYAQLKATETTDLLFGANYRFEDAISPYVGFNHKNIIFGASYDINTSDLGRLINGASSFEISLTFIGRKTVKTPEEHFICPRL